MHQKSGPLDSHSGSGRNHATTNTKETISVLIVDNHPVVRLGVTRLLEEDANICVVAEASEFDTGWELLRALEPDVVVAEFERNSQSLFELQSKVRNSELGTRLVLYTTHLTAWEITEAVRAGLEGIVSKRSKPKRLYDAIYAVFGGETYLDPAITTLVVDQILPQSKQPPPCQDFLSVREIAVLNRVASGRKNREIAQDLFISEYTVKYHLKSLFQKLRVKNRTAVVKIAIEKGLVTR